MKRKILNYAVWLLGGSTLVTAFNNCGEAFLPQQMGSDSFFSLNGGQTCEDALMQMYQSTFHPFLSQTCNHCHVSGPGLGNFASPNLRASYTSFTSIGAVKISAQAINDNHKPPYTGSHNQARVNELNSHWSRAQNNYLACLSLNGGGGPTEFVVKTNEKDINPSLGTSFSRVEWDLETQSEAKLPLIAGIDIRKSVVQGVTRGYEFRNPTLRLKNTNVGNYSARALNLYINGELQYNTTTYSDIEVLISQTTNQNLAPGAAYALAALTPGSDDKLFLEFSSLRPTSDLEAPPTTDPAPPDGGGGTPGEPNSMVLTFAQLTGTGGLFTTSCLSCHNGTKSDGGLNLTNYNAAKAAATNIKSRVNSVNNPMPPQGLLTVEQRGSITNWVNQGAPP